MDNRVMTLACSNLQGNDNGKLKFYKLKNWELYVLMNFYYIYSKTVSSQHKIPWEESFGHLAIWPDPQRPATTSSILPHSTG